MFNTSLIYRLFKPLENENLITTYEVIVGGTNLPANLEKGAIIINPISSSVLGSQFKDLQNLEYFEEKGYALIKEYSLIKNTYQVDVYKVNASNLNYIEAEAEALKLREWLKSLEVIEYLKENKAEILPCYSNIAFTNELYNNKFTNRASFDFEIANIVKINEITKVANKIILEKNIILQGELTNG